MKKKKKSLSSDFYCVCVCVSTADLTSHWTNQHNHIHGCLLRNVSCFLKFPVFEEAVLLPALFLTTFDSSLLSTGLQELQVINNCFTHMTPTCVLLRFAVCFVSVMNE